MGLELNVILRRDLPPLPWGTGGEKPPDGGLGANPIAVERASARRGLGWQTPYGLQIETEDLASIRTLGGRDRNGPGA